MLDLSFEYENEQPIILETDQKVVYLALIKST